MKNRAERVLLSFKAAVNDVTDLRPADGQGALILAWPRASGLLTAYVRCPTGG
jgi:hypothetical protein